MISVVDKIDVGMVKVIVDADAQLPSFVKVARREWSDSVTYVPIENVSRLQREKFKLEDENTKLLELVRGLNWCTEGPDCEHCPLGVVDGEPLDLMCEKMMRELGIEFK